MMGSAVISLHDGTDEVVWLATLPTPGSGGVVTVLRSPVTGPTAPSVEVKGNGAEGGNAKTDEGQVEGE
jgi:hypothetical protein